MKKEPNGIKKPTAIRDGVANLQSEGSKPSAFNVAKLGICSRLWSEVLKVRPNSPEIVWSKLLSSNDTFCRSLNSPRQLRTWNLPACKYLVEVIRAYIASLCNIVPLGWREFIHANHSIEKIVVLLAFR